MSDHVEFDDQRLPRKMGWVKITLSELAVKCLLEDLESDSKSHRRTTEEFKKMMKEWLERCESIRNGEENNFP